MLTHDDMARLRLFGIDRLPEDVQHDYYATLAMGDAPRTVEVSPHIAAQGPVAWHDPAAGRAGVWVDGEVVEGALVMRERAEG